MSSVAVVVLDTLRKDIFDEYFEWLPGRHYDRAFSTSHRTVTAHTSLFTGHYAGEVGVTGRNEQLTYTDRVLAEALQSAGYTTRAFSANPYVSGQFKFDRGFESFEKGWRLQSCDPAIFDWGVFISNTQDQGPERYLRALWQCLRSDCDTIRSLKHGAKLKQYDTGIGPFETDDGAKAALETVRDWSFGDEEFLFVNLMEAHAPYNPPSDYQTTTEPQFDGVRATVTGGADVDADRLRQSYEDSVRYLSAVYQDIFAELRTAFDYVITLSDHGELFGEHDAWNHCYGVYPELTHVPLVVTGDEERPHSDDTVVSLLDVHRTVLEIAGVDAESRGRPLLDGADSGTFLTECHGLTPRQHERLATEKVPQGTLEAFEAPKYGLAAPQSYYGYETRDGFVEGGESAIENPRERLKSLKSEVRERAPREASENEDLSEAVLNQLDDLGYT